MRAVTTLFVVALVVFHAPLVRGDDSKAAKEGITMPLKGSARGKNKLCCGYPLSKERGFRMTFYWMAVEHPKLPAEPRRDVYTRSGSLIGNFNESFIKELRMEGSGWLSDGTVVNYAGRCRYGIGVCFDVLDRRRFPYGRGALGRPLVPYKSVAVDRKLVAIGDTLYIPELDGVQLPDGSFHDGCVRADDVGGMIRRRRMDLFVVKEDNFHQVQSQMWFDWWFTPHIEEPRCAYLRDK